MHPKLVHVPIALCILMPMIASLIWFGIRRGWFSPRTWLIAVVLQGAMAVGGLAALQTGLDDAAKVEGYASEEALATHEARGYWFVYVAAANLVLCGGAFVLQRRQQLLGGLVIVGTLASAYAGYLVGDAGGRLVYIGNASDAHK
ncbi:MAG: hypothetical protein M4D80_14060 [Myxococcota bacterium]|nr:hypothetical protein [Myxococcota bacterium]